MLQDPYDDAKAILITNSSHCDVMHSDTEKDSIEMREVLIKIKLMIKS